MPKKKKITKKKVATKKTLKKKSTPRKPRQQMVQAIVPITDLLAPEMSKNKYTLATKNVFTASQIQAIIAPTPKNIIKNRPGKGGGKWDYVPGWWFKKKLNFVFGFDGWSFEILGERMEEGFVTVKGKLIIKDQKTGRVLTEKSDYGGAAIKMKGGKPLDLPNDFKAAQTDCVKRCCVQLGFAMDIYGKNEAISSGDFDKEIKASEQQTEETQYVEVSAKDDAPILCVGVKNGCPEGNAITEAEAKFSKQMYKRQLCRTCQAEKKGK